MINGIKAELLSVYERQNGRGVEVTLLAPEMSAFYAGEYLLVQAFAVEMAKAQSVECSRHPETPNDPQNTADCGEGIDRPGPVKSDDVSTARVFDRPRAIELAAWAIAHHSNDADRYGLYWGSGMAAVDDMPDILKDTAKTSMSEPVPPSTPGDDSANAAEGTQLADTAATPEGWIDVPDEPGALRRLKPGDRFKVGDVECAVVPVDMPANFGDWVERQMPPDTIICDPQWWAPRFWRAVFRNIER